MFTDRELRELSEMTSPKRFFLTVYLSGHQAAALLPGQFKELQRLLPEGEEGREEREQLEQNIEVLNEYLHKNPDLSGSLCVISCQARAYFRAISLPFPVRELVRVDTTPYIRPLAEIKDEYEGVAVIAADNKKAEIFMVYTDPAASAEHVSGHVKNHVKVGGWSQQRYERRRDKQLLHYAREIVDALKKLETEDWFRYVLLAGGREVLQAIHENMPAYLQEKVVEKNLDLKREKAVNIDIISLLAGREHREAVKLWEEIRAEFMRGGPAAVGIRSVLAAARAGRVAKVVVSREFKPEQWQCPDCQTVSTGALEICPACSLPLQAEGGLVNDLLEHVILTGGEYFFADSIESLDDAGGVAAMLRY